jgi:hypothetical protein
MPVAKIACVICNKPARTVPGLGDCTHFDCTECGQFGASGSFVEAAKSLSIAARRQALQKAIVRGQYGALSIVTTYDVP